MRKEPFTVGHYVHVYNRGNRKQEIVRDDLDKRHFLHALYYLNSSKTPSNPFQSLRTLRERRGFEINEYLWPVEWQPRDPLVAILVFILRDNHFHMLLKEVHDGGVSRFMRKLGNSMTNRFNTRYAEVGRLFQGSYKARTVSADNHLHYLPVYIQVKNSFESYPGGVGAALQAFPTAYREAVAYPYSSLAAFVGKTPSPIIEADELLINAYPDASSFRQFARETVRDVDFNEKTSSIEVKPQY